MFDKFSSLEHLHNSFLVAYKGRNKTKEVISYKQNLEENLLNLRNKLLNFTYHHRKYRTFIVEDSKKRVINAPSFEDHILHHAIFSFLENIFEKKFIENSFANRKGKGSHSAVLKLQNQSKKFDWFLKMDITKYFSSVDQEILFEQIKRHLKDEKFLLYIKMVIGSYLETNIINSLTNNKTGMPIGNVTSQLFANIYLHDLDFYVEHEIKPLIRKFDRNIFYIRYVDDFVFLSNDKQDLILIKKFILDFLENKLKLSVSEKKLVLNNISSGIPFLGYNIFREKLKVRNDTIRRFRRRIREYSIEKKLNSLISFKGHCDLANKKLISSLSERIFFGQNFNKICPHLKGTINSYKYKKEINVLCMKQSRETVKRNSQEKQSRETVKRNSQEKQSINYVSYNSQNSFFNSSKAISPVVSTALLLVVAVVAVVGFQGWFQTFTSSTFVKVEQEGSIGSMNTLIETIVGSNLYFKNGYSNLTITDIQIDGTSCNISDSYGSGMSEIDLGNCTLNATSSTPDVVIITDKGIFSKKIYLKNIVTSSSVISNLDCSTLNGGEWSLVPGNGELGTSDFCVMNYEAKWNGSGTINNVGSAYCGSGDDYNVSTGCIDDTEGVISQANSLPLRNVNQFEAIELCSRLGSNYHLVTDAEWVTIARNIEQLDANWDSGTAYTGSLKRGNTGDVVAGVAYNAASDPADRSLDTNSLALLNLSNGEGIWDFSGNLWEWTSDTLPRSGVLNSSLGEGTGEGWAQWNTISLSYDYLKPFNTSLTSANGIGRVYYHGGLSWPNGATWDTNHGFLRGGSWLSGANAGGFALVLGYGPSLSDSTFGFRCSYAP